MSPRTAALVLLTMLSVWSNPASGDEGDGGRPGAYLRLSTGARAIGLGGAFVGVADDPSAIYWNIGGIARIGGSVQLSASRMSLDRFHYQGSLVLPAGKAGSIGMMWNSLRISGLEMRDISGNQIGSFDSIASVVTLGWARRYWGGISVGGAAKYYQHSLDRSTGAGVGFDAGVHLKIPPDPESATSICVGASASDLGGELEWDTEAATTEDIPVTYRFGMSLDSSSVKRSFLLALAYSTTEGEEGLLSGGAEFWIHESAALRIGGSKDDTAYGATFVVGSLQLDYSYADDVLERGGQSTISLSYGSSRPRHGSQSSSLESSLQ